MAQVIESCENICLTNKKLCQDLCKITCQEHASSINELDLNCTCKCLERFTMCIESCDTSLS
jgi:hypothetical protein